MLRHSHVGYIKDLEKESSENLERRARFPWSGDLDEIRVGSSEYPKEHSGTFRGENLGESTQRDQGAHNRELQDSRQ